MSKHDEARRAFLKGAAAGAGAIAGTGLAPQAIPQALAKPQERHKIAVADAAETASEAPTSFGDAGRCDEPVGSRISTRLSQNAIRNRKNIRPVSPAACIAAPVRNLTGSAESRVRATETFLLIVEKNTPQIFVELEKI